MCNFNFEQVGGGIKIAVSKDHTFMTDSFLLSYFSTPKQKDVVCDFGSGCGVIPLLWFRDSKTTPKSVTSVDLQPKAVEQMHASISASNINNFMPMLADIKDIPAKLPAGSFDLVTCNPPYKTNGSGIISSSTSDKIARHETMCTINDICKSAAWLLKFGGRLCICQLTERLVDVLCAMRDNGIEPKKIRFVQNTFDSSPWLFMVEGKRGSKPFLQVDPPLILREDSKISKEMEEIYGMYGKVV